MVVLVVFEQVLDYLLCEGRGDLRLLADPASHCNQLLDFMCIYPDVMHIAHRDDVD